MLWASFCDQLLGLSGLKNYIENKNLGYSVKIWISDKLMNVLKIAQICQIWNILELEKCLKFNSNWASCTLSDKPTDGQLQAKKKRWSWNPCHWWVTQRPETKRTPTTNQRATTLVIYTDWDSTGRKLQQLQLQMLLSEQSRFPQSWLCKFLRDLVNQSTFLVL